MIVDDGTNCVEKNLITRLSKQNLPSLADVKIVPEWCYQDIIGREREGNCKEICEWRPEGQYSIGVDLQMRLIFPNRMHFSGKILKV